MIVIVLYFVRQMIRFTYEVMTSKNLIYLQVTLPRGDSKLDKERETKKDFKEKIGIMAVVYKAIHKISSTSMKQTLLNAIFNHIKASFEFVYKDGRVFFYLVTYRDFVHIISQQIISGYPDAEIREVPKSEYVDLTANNYHLRSSSISTDNDPYFPIRTYKYFEEDPLSSFTSIFGSLNKTDRAVYQIVLKPVSERWNKKAKKIARQYAKGEYVRKTT